MWLDSFGVMAINGLFSWLASFRVRVYFVNLFLWQPYHNLFLNKMEHNDIQNIEEAKNRLKDFEIPKKERLMKLKLIQKLIENTDENNLNDNLKAISKMLKKYITLMCLIY